LANEKSEGQMVNQIHDFLRMINNSYDNNTSSVLCA